MSVVTKWHNAKYKLDVGIYLFSGRVGMTVPPLRSRASVIADRKHDDGTLNPLYC